MTTPALRFLTVMLVLVLGLTSASMAVAKAGMPLHGVMILCVGSEAITVPVGPDGAPQETAHLCPDCTMGSLAQPPAAAEATAPAEHSAMSWTPASLDAPALAPVAASARAPPMQLL